MKKATSQAGFHPIRHDRLEHPFQRIIGCEKQQDAVSVTTTDIHLARTVGEAVQRVFQAALEFHCNRNENLLRVHWTH